MREYRFFKAGSPNIDVRYRCDQFGGNRNNLTVMQILGLDTDTETNLFAGFKRQVFTEEDFINHAVTHDLALVSSNSNGGEVQVLDTGELVISTASPMAGGNESVAYDEDVVATGGSGNYIFTLSAGALPTGLTLSSAGNIAGTPTTADTYDFTVRVDDLETNNFVTKALQIVISA